MTTDAIERTRLAQAGIRLAKARRVVDDALAIARAVGRAACADGAPEAATARELGVDRMALRKWRGKR